MQIIEIPDLSFRYQLGEHTVTLDPIDTMKRIDEINIARRGCTNYEHLDDFARYVESQNPGVVINRSIADWLMDHLRGEVLRQKKERLDGWPSFSQPTQG